MKRKFSLIFAVIICFSMILSGCDSGEIIEINYLETTAYIDYSQYKDTELKVYNWGSYISDGSEGTIDVNAEFEKLTGIKVIYDNFDSNESLYAKLSSGGADYDVIIPSDYMIGRLIKEGYIAELNFDNIPNYQYVSERYQNTEYDPENKYTVPYSVGMVGIVYNTSVIEEEPTSWSLMWDAKYSGKILNFNNPRDAFAIAQFYGGLDINSEDKTTWDKAYNMLVEQKSKLQGYVMDEVFNKMESGEAAVAPYYAGDFFTMYGNNEDLAFYYPEEGTNIFIDAACVLKTSKNKGAAELYINFLMDPEIARANAEYTYYASPNTAVMENEDYIEYLSELHPDAYEILYKSSELVPTDSFVNISDETKSYMTQKWTELRATNTENNGDTIVYIICGVLLATIIAGFGYNAFIKKQRAKNYE